MILKSKANGRKFLKLLFSAALIALLFNVKVCEASHVNFSFGVVESYPAPVPVQTTAWIPGHWDGGYWVPAQYVQYNNYQPAPSYVYVDDYGYYPRHHWHRHHYYY